MLATPVVSAQIAPSFMSVNTAVVEELKKEIPDAQQSAYLEFSEEEHLAVLTKLKTVVKQPAGHLPQQEELYLEQQLTDMLGFDVSAELEGQRLNHSLGTMAALPHLKRLPNDTLAQHDKYQEAGLSKFRSAFGWLTEMGQLTPDMKRKEEFYISVQAPFTPNWHQHYAELKKWYQFRKMLVINPMANKAVVTVVGDFGPAHWLQYQFGGSPEVIREVGVWDMKSRGKVIVLFINDPNNSVPLGPISLEYQDLLAHGKIVL